MPLMIQIAQLILDHCHVNVFKDQSNFPSLFEENLVFRIILLQIVTKNRDK